MIGNIEELKKIIINELANFTNIGVVGLSGGVDSLVITCLLVEALGAKNVFCLHMPHNSTDYTPGKFNDNSIKIAEKLGVQSKIAPIGDSVLAIAKYANKEIPFITSLNEGNVRARIRMVYLYAEAGELAEIHKPKKVRVIGTDNLSESYIGYFTKYGDGAADFFPIGELYKSEVYQLAEHYVNIGLIDKDMIDYNPSAGLWENQSDADELGYTYDEMEPAIRYLRMEICEGGYTNQDYIRDRGFAASHREKIGDVGKFVSKRHLINKHKLKVPPVISLRKLCH